MASIVNQIANNLNPQTIDGFKATLGRRSGLARQNRFAVFITPPQGVLLNTDIEGYAADAASDNFNMRSIFNDPRDIALLCESASLPGKQIQTLDYNYQGYRQSVKYPIGYINEDLNLVFHITNDYFIKKLFDAWQNACISPVTYTTPYDAEYKADIVIQQLNEQNIPVYGVKLRNAFPATVNTVELNNDAANNTQKLSVTMAYEEMTPVGFISSTVEAGKTILEQVENTKERLGSILGSVNKVVNAGRNLLGRLF
tara:strand:- start:684 stop:1451 length:768 start_codon:yes stop_codon:yes gene_type:complete